MADDEDIRRSEATEAARLEHERQSNPYVISSIEFAEGMVKLAPPEMAARASEILGQAKSALDPAGTWQAIEAYQAAYYRHLDAAVVAKRADVLASNSEYESTAAVAQNAHAGHQLAAKVVGELNPGVNDG